MVADRERVGGDLRIHVEIFERSVGGGAVQVLVKIGADAAGLGLRQGCVRTTPLVRPRLSAPPRVGGTERS